MAEETKRLDVILNCGFDLDNLDSILSGEKKIEYRKIVPPRFFVDFPLHQDNSYSIISVDCKYRFWLYCGSPIKKILGCVDCDKGFFGADYRIWDETSDKSNMDEAEYIKYSRGKDPNLDGISRDQIYALELKNPIDLMEGHFFRGGFPLHSFGAKKAPINYFLALNISPRVKEYMDSIRQENKNAKKD